MPSFPTNSSGPTSDIVSAAVAEYTVAILYNEGTARYISTFGSNLGIALSRPIPAGDTWDANAGLVEPLGSTEPFDASPVHNIWPLYTGFCAADQTHLFCWGVGTSGQMGDGEDSGHSRVNPAQNVINLFD